MNGFFKSKELIIKPSGLHTAQLLHLGKKPMRQLTPVV